MGKLTLKKENRIIIGGLILFWTFYWLFNTIDKVMGRWPILWEGKDRLTQFTDYFLSINIANPAVANTFLWVVTILELVAFIFMLMALISYFKKDKVKTRDYFFKGVLVSLIIFSFFTIGDQMFRDRYELWEHTSYWIALVISWFVFTKAER